MEFIERKISETPEAVAEYTELGQLYDQKYEYMNDTLCPQFFSLHQLWFTFFRLWHQLAVKVEDLLLRNPHFSGDNALQVRLFALRRDLCLFND